MEKKSSEKVTLNVDGMTCNNCAAGIKKHLESHYINNVDVNFSLGEISFKLDQNNSLNQIIELIEKIGYKVKKQKTSQNKFSKICEKQKKR